MSDLDQVPFGAAEFAENAEMRCPCILLLDTSGSMGGEPINELNNGLRALAEELRSDAMASKRVDLAIVSFGPVIVELDFTNAGSLTMPELTASGNTPMGEAIEKAITILNERKNLYRSNGVAYYRPWIFLITDGAPTDAWQNAVERIKIGEERKEFMFYPVGVSNADMNILTQLSVRSPLKLKGLSFSELFRWLSSSLGAVSASGPGDKVSLTNPATPDGWAEVI